MRDVLYVNDMAERLQLSPKAIYQHIYRRTGLVPPAQKVGKKWVWTESGYQKWLRQLETKS